MTFYNLDFTLDESLKVPFVTLLKANKYILCYHTSKPFGEFAFHITIRIKR